jgi:hypothetical protein
MQLHPHIAPPPLDAPRSFAIAQARPAHPRARRRRRRLRLEGTTLLAIAMFAAGTGLAGLVAWVTGTVY